MEKWCLDLMRKTMPGNSTQHTPSRVMQSQLYFQQLSENIRGERAPGNGTHLTRF